MSRIYLTRKICDIFPPVISRKLRHKLYPRKLSISQRVDFKKKSVTGSVFEGNTEDNHAYTFCFHGYYDWRNIIIVDLIFKNGMGDIIEIGANIGTETICYCDIVKQKGVVHAFEPLPSNFKLLEKLSVNRKNLFIYNVAISDKNGEDFFYVPPRKASGTGRLISPDLGDDNEFVRVHTTKLDDFSDSFNQVTVISIDTEGHEPFVLKGGQKVITDHRPVVILEVAPKLLDEYGAKVEDISSFFNKLSYKMFRITRFSISEIKEEDLQAKDSSTNWVCIPDEQIELVNEIKRHLFLRALIPWYLLKKLPSKK